MIQYYDRQGQKIMPYQWQMLAMDKSYTQVKLNEGREYVILTVWLGIAHVKLGFNKDRMFKTMFFKKLSDGSLFQWTLDFFKTEKKALKYHERLTKAVEDILKQKVILLTQKNQAL